MPPPLLVDLDSCDLSRVQFTREQIYEELPQRHEFMLLDGVLYMDAKEGCAVAYHDVRDDEFWVRGHLPGRPLLPGVLMLEAAAQIAGFTIQHALDYGGRFVGLGGVHNAKFRDQVEPNCRMLLLVKVDKVKSRRVVCKAQGVVAGRIVFEAEITGMPM